jgi:D-lactate dehydrogenase
MQVAIYSTKPYDRRFFESVETPGHEFTFLEPRLTAETAILARGHEAVCVFVHDMVDATVLRQLAETGCRLVAIRAAGYNNVDLEAAERVGIEVVRVPAYSPDGVAEFTIGLMMTLNRGMHRAHDRIRRGNFSLEGLMGFNMAGKTVGVIGTGKIGESVANILLGFRCKVIAYDVNEAESLKRAGVAYSDLDTLLSTSDIITLHVPLLKQTRHLINADSIRLMKKGVMLINTSRGELIDTPAVIAALKTGQVGSLGIDVYEDEEGIFFEDHSNSVVADDQLMRLTTFPNVILTSHQAFFTREAMENIVRRTLDSITQFAESGTCDPKCLLTKNT